MMRALFAGVSGLRNHLTRMDVIGNNIANVNTVAFKSSRVTFKEAFAQLLQGASKPPGDQGGINPIQVGLGMSIGSIDQNFSQGNLESTGQNTDLAIQGDGFFVCSDGRRRYFTRSGNFQLDADGRLVAPTNGFIVQGRTADAAGALSSGAPVGDVILPFGQKSPAKPSSEVSFAGNLDSRATPLGTILQTRGMVFATELTGTSDVNGLCAENIGQIVGMTPGGNSTVTVRDGTLTGGVPNEVVLEYVTADTGGANDGKFHSLSDLVNELNHAGSGTHLNSFTALMVAGQITITATAAITLTIDSSNATLQSALGARGVALDTNGATPAPLTLNTALFAHVATEADALTQLWNEDGVPLGLGAADVITVAGNLGTNSVSTALTVGALTYGSLLALINSSTGFDISNAADGAVIDESTGALAIHGDGGTANAITAVNITAGTPGAAEFDAIFGSGGYTSLQTATDATHTASISVYDTMGNDHTISMTFTKDARELNRWTWSATVPEPALVAGGDSGAVTFDSEGRIATFTYEGSATSFQFNPNTGATTPVDIAFNPGDIGSILGLSQFASASTAVASGQDGYPMGNLQDISIDNMGVITGFFTNGVSQTIAQISLASFNNPTGLLRRGDNMYEVSGNSGNPVLGFAGTSNQSSITSGALESSNVDLAAEFTNMIIAQRGFQANSRVITTSDEMLQELVNLKR
jgi:flagellar hook protein FlgE